MTAIDFAIKMELDGEKYYLEQGEKAGHAGLKAVFALLAAEERAHAELLEKYKAKKDYELKDSQVPAHFKGIFENEKDLQIEYKARPDQLDAYQLALEKEQESIVLYEKMGAEAGSEEEKRLFNFLVEQEKIHYNMFQDLIEHVIKARQWVESAEFGLREDY
ncbi:MAG: ferritin family protein [Firmicutes bacterium]|nr:ferritin family protein [Bacillota bacterium]